MSQQQKTTRTKRGVRLTDTRSYSTHRPTLSAYSSVQNGEELSHSKKTKESYKTIQQLTPSLKPQLAQQLYRDKIQELEVRLSQQNKFLREITDSTLIKLEQANATISRITKERENLEKESRALMTKYQMQNGSLKELTELADRLRKENTSLNLKINKLTSTLEGRSKRIPRQKQSNLVGLPEMDLDGIMNNNETSKRASLYHSLTLGPMKSPDKGSVASRENSLNNSKRSYSRSNYSAQLSPKQSARMQVLFEEIGIIKKNLKNGGKISQSVVNKLFSLINHLTNALNKRNDENAQLKTKLNEYEQMLSGDQNQHIRNGDHTLESDDFSLQSPSPLYQKSNNYSSRSINKPRSSLDNYPQVPLKYDMNMVRPSSFRPTERTNLHSRNQSAELKRDKYNYVYKKIELEEYLQNKIQIAASMQLVTKITELVEKNLMGNPRVLKTKDFYILYCEGQCPNNLRIRVQLKPSFDQNTTSSVRQLDMMESLGCIFEEILKSIKIQSFADQNLFEKAVSPAFEAIIKNLRASEQQRMNMEKLKLLLHRLHY